MKQKRDYEEPTMEVLELEQETELLVGSFEGEREETYGEPETW